ncbi:MAG: hypothetical protein F6J98_44110 [Moorea sp. SIO4G2]|uniref:hypothetical protein n=1 Tax=Moorena bouillonii TaxID=207920 RepID=UPI00117CB406|nr:hypothetical protein [Moorena bouillonii]NEO66971.1 hypothetical protein [Moorena sp. SIO4G2]
MQRGLGGFPHSRFASRQCARDFKSGGYSIEGSKLTGEYLSKLMIVVAIAYTSAMLQGRHIKQMGIQKYVVRPETQSSGQRRHSGATQGRFTRPLKARTVRFLCWPTSAFVASLKGIVRKNSGRNACKLTVVGSTITRRVSGL